MERDHESIEKGLPPGSEKLDLIQEVLDSNKMLIEQINENHELKTQEALARNVSLIIELNRNINKVVELYKDMSTTFAAAPVAMPGKA